MNTRYTSKLFNGTTNERLVKFIIVVVTCIATLLLCITSQYYEARAALKSGNADAELSEEYSSMFSQNNIYGWNPNECTQKSSSGLCGDTATAIYWSALSKYIDDPIKVAGVVGNLANEGGMNPVAWEGVITNSDGSLTNSWESIYNGALDGTKGVGAFGITSGLSEYLHYINDNHPDLIKYFQDGPEYNFNYIHPGSGVDDSHPSYGDVLLEKIGKEEFSKLVEAEVKYAIEDFNPPRTQAYLGQSFSNPYDAAVWWMDEWERPAARNPDDRGGAAKKAYDEFNGMVCSGSSSNSSSSSGSSGSNNNSSSSSGAVSGDNITFIGDSLTGIGTEDLFNEYFSGADYGSSFNKCHQGDMSSYICSGKRIVGDMGTSGGPGGLEILERIVSENKLRPILVFALGANSQWTQSYVDELLKLVGNDTKVLILTTKTIPPHSLANGGYDANNDFLKQTAEKYDNIYVADWAAEVKDENFTSDGLHYTYPDGYKAYYQFILDNLNNLGSCTTYEGEYPQYYQSGESWSSQSYDGGTIGSSGCGPTSLAMLATVATGTDIFPQEVAALTNGSGYGNNYVESRGSTMVALDQKVGEKYGFTVENVGVSSLDDTEAKMKEYLNKGYMIHLSGAGSKPFSSGGHYIGIFSIKGDTVMVADSSNGNQEYNLHDLIHSGYHGDAFSAIKVGGGKTSCDSDACPDDGGSGSYSGGFKSLEDAEKVIMDPYRDLAANHPEQWGEYNITAGTPYNCFSFSNYFISKYTSIDFHGVPGVDGGGYADEFYNIYHGNYPEITLSDKPTPFSVAGCGDKIYSGANYSHTFIVLGVDESKDTMIYGEAAYGSGSSGVIANEISLSDPSWGSRNGSTGICTYANFSKYIEGL